MEIVVVLNERAVNETFFSAVIIIATSFLFDF